MARRIPNLDLAVFEKETNQTYFRSPTRPDGRFLLIKKEGSKRIKSDRDRAFERRRKRDWRMRNDGLRRPETSDVTRALMVAYLTADIADVRAAEPVIRRMFNLLTLAGYDEQQSLAVLLGLAKKIRPLPQRKFRSPVATPPVPAATPTSENIPAVVEDKSKH